MSGRETPAERCESGADVAAYALGALEPEEAQRLALHLESCEACREELGALQAAADALPLAAPQLRAPRRLRRELFAAVREDARGPDHARSASRSSSGGRTRARGLAAAAPAAACAVVLAVLLATGGSGGSHGSRVVSASVSAPGASAVLRVSAGAAQLSVSGMPAPPAGKIYEVWLKRAGAVPEATDALFGVTAAGAASVAVPGSLSGVREVLVTPEPLGGSRTPTHAPVIVARLS